ncbi:hypothetical protein D3C85_1399900 [compost metagenome]
MLPDLLFMIAPSKVIPNVPPMERKNWDDEVTTPSCDFGKLSWRASVRIGMTRPIPRPITTIYDVATSWVVSMDSVVSR